MYPLPDHIKNCRVMVFVDGENLAMRYGAMLGETQQYKHVVYEKDVFVWSNSLATKYHRTCEIVRQYYYTSACRDDPYRQTISERLKAVGIEAPRVFPRKSGRGSKRVDVSLTVDMLTHAHRGNYDLAVLVTGDEDYVPLVEAVIAEGKRVALWALESGLSDALKNSADYFLDFGQVLFRENPLQYFGSGG